MRCRSESEVRGDRSNRDRTPPAAVHSDIDVCSDDDEQTKRLNFDDDCICGGCDDDIDCSESFVHSSQPSKPCPSDDDCFDPCKRSSSRRGGRGASRRNDHRQRSKSPCSGGGGTRKPTRSASEICAECTSMKPSRRSPSTRHRDSCCDEVKTGRTSRKLSPDCGKASLKRSADCHEGGSGGAKHRSPSRSTSRGSKTGESGEQRSGRTTSPTSRSRPRRHSATSRDEDDCQDEGSLERTTSSRIVGGGTCCPDPEERDCEGDSR